MIIGRLLAPIHSLGPGERIGLWTQGCSKHCDGCVSLDLQPFGGRDIPEETLAQLIIQTASLRGCTGLTISGGDPFEQPSALLALLRAVRKVFDDILVYTGFTLEEIQNGIAFEDGKLCLDYIDVLIDGRYQKELNKPTCVLRGSLNQTIHFFNKDLAKKYYQYMEKGRILETFNHGDSTIITGILNEEE